MPKYNYSCSLNITYRAFIDEDNNTLHEQLKPLLTNPNYVTYYCTGQSWSDDSISSFISTQQTQWSHDGFGSYTAYSKLTNEFIGYVTLNSSTEYSTHPNAIEIGYFVNPAFQGQGYGKEMAQFAYDQMNIHFASLKTEKTHEYRPTEMIATVHPKNNASKKILEHVLTNQEEHVYTIARYNNAPRMLFFKSFDKNKNTASPHNTDTHNAMKL